MTTKRVPLEAQKQRRGSPGAAIAAPLLEWLNNAMADMQENRQARESFARVVSFGDAISEYTRQRAALNSALKKRPATEEMVLRAADKDFDLQNEITAILARINDVAPVDRFDAASFACDLPGGKVKPVEIWQRGERGRSARQDRRRGRVLKSGAVDEDLWKQLEVGPSAGFRELPAELVVTASEADAVSLVFGLARQNHISNVHRCSRCLRFFYSSQRKGKHRFCSPQCHDHFLNATGKAKRARQVAKKKRRAKERDEESKFWAKKQSKGLLKPKRRTHR